MNNLSRPLYVRYLSAIFCLGLATLAVTLISWLPVPDGWTVWVKRTFTVGNILCLFLLTPVNPRYRKSAFFRTAIFCCTILSLLIGRFLPPILISLVSFALSIPACWHLYRAHSELISAHNEKLAQNWQRLFWWELAFTVVSTVISTVSYLWVTVLPQTSFAVISVFTTVSSWLIVILQAVLTAVSLVFLFLTIKIWKQQA